MMLYEDKSEQEVVEELAKYFNNISNEYSPLDLTQIPRTFEAEIPVITEEQVKKEVKEGKKPKSRVEGDMFIGVLVSCIDVLAVPVSKIFNAITQKACWPSKWKTEYVTVIPKCASPESESDCRNISYTNYILVKYMKESSSDGAKNFFFLFQSC